MVSIGGYGGGGCLDMLGFLGGDTMDVAGHFRGPLPDKKVGPLSQALVVSCPVARLIEAPPIPPKSEILLEVALPKHVPLAGPCQPIQKPVQQLHVLG